MTKAKTTPWFKIGGKTDPKRPGVYELRSRKEWGRRFAMWNGDFWGCVCTDVALAYQHGEFISSLVEEGAVTQWRGLTAPSE
jgi:hypothetical protein